MSANKVFLPTVISDLFGVSPDVAERAVQSGSTEIDGKLQNFSGEKDLWLTKKQVVGKEVKVESKVQTFTFVVPDDDEE